MELRDFEDWRIDEVRRGAPLTKEERTFLVEDTPRFEECSNTSEELSAMSDSDLMSTAYRVWADYVSCM